MTIKYIDRVFETTQSSGTGTINLDGPVTNFQSFALAGNNARVGYMIDEPTKWEIGIGTVLTGSPNQLARMKVLSSSNSNALVNFGTGNVKNVRLLPVAALLMSRDEGLNFSDLMGDASGSTANAHTVAMPVTPVAYTNGAIIMYRATLTNTTAAVTVNVNGLGAKALKVNGVDPGAGMIFSGKLVIAIYNAASDWCDMITGDLPLTGGNMTGAVNEAMTTMASAATADIWTGQANKINWTGTVAATGFANAPQAGAERVLFCAGAAQFTAGANFVIDGIASGATITLAAGDRMVVTALTTAQFRGQIIKADASSISSKATFDGYRSGSASPANAIVIIDTPLINTGAYNTSTGVFTCPRPGRYDVSITGIGSAGGTASVRKNSNIVRGTGIGTAYISAASVVLQCNAGDTIDYYSTVSLILNNTTPGLRIIEL